MEKIKFVDFLKENIGIASWTIILVLLGFLQKDLFWIFLLMYVFVVRLFLSDFFQEKTKKNIAKIIWVSVCLIFLAGYYVNNFMPSGEMIDLTEYGCEPGAVSDRQVKSDCYQENLANLQIPKWAKFLKVYGVIILFGLSGLGLAIQNIKSGDSSDGKISLKSEEAENEEIISAYNLLKRAVPDYDEPNYELAKKVFLDFNDFNLRNNENGLTITIYLGFIPKSLLPYPKNYIKCAYYIFLEKLKKENNLKMFKNVQEIGASLFFKYPDYKKYKENLVGKNTNGNGKKWIDEGFKDMVPNPRETFKKLYGVYEISEEDYNSSPSSIDCTDEKLIHDFGILPEIERDVDFNELLK